MNRFSLFLLDKGLIRLSLRNVKWWIKKRNISFLEYATQNGLHNIRREAIIGLGMLNAQDSKPILVKAIDDSFKSVSLAAIKALENMNPSNDLVSRMKQKEAYWKERTVERNPKEKWNSLVFKRERGSKITMEHVKELLRKPINIGKWF